MQTLACIIYLQHLYRVRDGLICVVFRMRTFVFIWEILVLFIIIIHIYYSIVLCRTPKFSLFY